MKVQVTTLTFASSTLLVFVLPSPAQADSISYTGTTVITTVNSSVTEIALGDRFHFNFKYDDSVLDTNASLNDGQFTGAITNFHITADPANVGPWNPVGGVLTLPGNMRTLQISPTWDRVIGNVFGTGFPDGGAGVVFNFFTIDISNFNYGQTVLTDSGSGESLADQLGGTALNDPAFNQPNMSINFVESGFTANAYGSIEDLTRVPEPASLAHFVLATLGLGSFIWRRKYHHAL